MPSEFEQAFEKARAKEVDLYVQEVSLMRQLIRERSTALDLLRELISNAAAREVQAENIWIRCYPHPEDVYVFEVEDDGIGMDYADKPPACHYARLYRFLSLGLSAVVGAKSDEFSWKGLGSKLAFHSRRLVVETWTGQGPVRRVEVIAPWDTITAGRKPKPKVFELDPTPSHHRGTKITVYGHPPDVQREYSMREIKDHLLHRTFVGFTRDRSSPPKIHLAVGGMKEDLEFGFPVLKRMGGDPGESTRFVNLVETTGLSGKNFPMTVTLKGLYSVEASRFGIAPESGNSGLILSVMGIPYFDLNFEQYTRGRRGLGINPSARNCCLIVECDQIQEEMNISRSAINDGAVKEAFDTAVQKLLARVSESEDYKAFVAHTKRQKDIRGAETLDQRKRKLAQPEQRWVYYTGPDGKLRRLHREPENENDTLAVLWKMEAMGVLPFHQFESLEHGSSGADIIAHFRETPESNPERFVTVEAESAFSNYKPHGHNPSQMPLVICWDLSKSRKVRLRETNTPWKFVAEVGDVGVRVFAIARMPGIKVSRENV
ncbi:MAG TPA: hypothetical protein DCX07_02840 [Phycisphaerales bacterium]|nr:hypothetical protein [Phycisphaerales bacterium]